MTVEIRLFVHRVFTRAEDTRESTRSYHLYGRGYTYRAPPPTKNISLCHTILAKLKLERRGGASDRRARQIGQRFSN